MVSMTYKQKLEDFDHVPVLKKKKKNANFKCN